MKKKNPQCSKASHKGDKMFTLFTTYTHSTANHHSRCTNQMAHYTKRGVKQKPKRASGHTCFHFIFITLCQSEVCKTTRLLHGRIVVRRKTHHWWRYSGETTGNDPFSFSSIFLVGFWLHQTEINRKHSCVMHMWFGTLRVWQCVKLNACARATKDKQEHTRYQQKTQLGWRLHTNKLLRRPSFYEKTPEFKSKTPNESTHLHQLR